MGRALAYSEDQGLLGSLRARGRRASAAAALLAPASVVACLEAEPEVSGYLMYEVHALTGAEPELAGAACMAMTRSGVTSGSSGTADGSDDFAQEDRTDDSGYTLTVKSEGEVIEERHFDPEFVERGERAQFEVTTHAGVVYRFVYWGGSTCEVPAVE